MGDGDAAEEYGACFDMSEGRDGGCSRGVGSWIFMFFN